MPRTPQAAEQLIFYTQRDRTFEGKPLVEWLLQTLRDHDFHGATITGGLVGDGHDGATHVVTLFDDSQQPIQITVIAPAARVSTLLEGLAGRDLGLFYTRLPVIAGVL